MFEGVREQFQGELDEIAAAGLDKPERVIASPQGAHVTLADGREVLNLCANNYLGLADHPAVLAAAARRARRARLRHGVGALHLRHAGHPPRARGSASARSSAARTRSSTRPASTPTAGLFETLLGERGRDHLRRAQPRLDHRRHPALQGAPAALREPRHGRARAAPARGRGRAAAPDRDRRRVLDGRLRRAARRASASSPSSTTRWSWSTTRTPSASSAPTAAARRSCTASPSASTSSPARSARRSAARAAATRAGGARSSSCCASARGRTSSPTASRRRSSPPASRCSTCWRARAPTLRERLFAHTARFRRELTALGFDVLPGEHPIVPVMFGDAHRAARRGRARCSSTASTSSRSPTRSCRMGQARIRTQLSAAHSDDDVDARDRGVRRVARASAADGLGCRAIRGERHGVQRACPRTRAG